MRAMLVVEDDPAFVRLMQRAFTPRGWVVLEAPDGRTALERLRREDPEVVLLDLGLPDIRGLDLLEVLRREDRDAAVIVITGRREVEVAVEAMRLGAENFLAKPVDVHHLEAAVERAYEKVRLQRQHRALIERHNRGGDRGGLEAALSEQVRAQVELLAGADSTVLLQGETGTGKSLVARLIHAESGRAGRPFVEVNCAGLSAALLESELFGHERGAFTDAKAQKRGLFEVADGGSIFLDEVGDMAPDLQPKLLTVLETRRFRRVGGTREISVDVRLIAATNRDLAEEVKAGRFRQDLYYRLAVLPLSLPPLRERPAEEVVRLAYAVLADLQRRFGGRTRRIAQPVLELLVRYPWPGNVRELRNTLERCLLSCRGEEEIQLRHADIVPHPVSVRVAEGYDPVLTLEEVERRHIARVLQQVAGHRARAAEALGISTRSIYDRIRRLGIEA